MAETQQASGGVRASGGWIFTAVLATISKWASRDGVTSDRAERTRKATEEEGERLLGRPPGQRLHLPPGDPSGL